MFSSKFVPKTIFDIGPRYSTCKYTVTLKPGLGESFQHTSDSDTANYDRVPSNGLYRAPSLDDRVFLSWHRAVASIPISKWRN